MRANEDTLVITVESKGKAPMPSLLLAWGASGDTTSLTVPVDVWLPGEKKVRCPHGGAR